jgi:hypothetical protein
MTKGLSFDMQELTERSKAQITVQVNVTESCHFKLRTWVGSRIIKLGCMVIGFSGFAIDIVSNDA